jgi:hypothetical protein
MTLAVTVNGKQVRHIPFSKFGSKLLINAQGIGCHGECELYRMTFFPFPASVYCPLYQVRFQSRLSSKKDKLYMSASMPSNPVNRLVQDTRGHPDVGSAVLHKTV